METMIKQADGKGNLLLNPPYTGQLTVEESELLMAMRRNIKMEVQVIKILQFVSRPL